MHRFSLRFSDRNVEARFQRQYFRDNLPYIRAAHLVGILAWAFFGLYTDPGTNVGPGLHVWLNFGVAIPIIAASLALTHARWYVRVWQTALVALIVVLSGVGETHRIVTGHAPRFGSIAGLLLGLAALFMLLRVQYIYAASGAALVIVGFTATTIVFPARGGVGLAEADVWLITFALIGTAAAYALERFARLLFIRERELDRERDRGDRLLRNILPDAIVRRLKTRDPDLDARRIAQRYDEVSVLFADLVGFTEQASTTDPGELVSALDDVFRRFDQLADRFGLEKIKTVGDAYMAAAGVPQPRPGHAQAAVEMSLAARDCISGLRWPSGEMMAVRIGIASGPVVAGVIGRRKFAYDVWGDTVNTASRLESSTSPGAIQVSEAVYRHLSSRYRFSEPYVVELKGKGPTVARLLEGKLLAETMPALHPR